MGMTFEQRREHHAIGEFTATVRFFKALSGNTFARAAAELAAYASAHKLPAPVTRQVISFQLDQTGATAPITTPQIAGWQRFAPTGEPDVTILCDDSSIQYVTRTYTSWIEIREVLADFFCQIGEIYTSEVPAVTSFQLQYLNEFRDTSESFNPGQELFRSENDWIIPNVSRFQDAWHSHCGSFEQLSEQHRRLINVNVDCRRQPFPGLAHPASLISLLILVAENFDVPGEQPLIVPPNLLRQQLLENFDSAHTREKAILSELLVDQYLEKMGALSRA